MIHALITAFFCSVVSILEWPVWLYTLPVGFYIGREFAQAEYRYIAAYCDGKRANMPWYAPFTPAAWTVKSLLDWILPTVVGCCFIL